MLAVLLTGIGPVRAVAYSAPSLPPKEEVVYVKLLADGSFDSAYVVNSFELDRAGSFIDYGSYQAVHNLSTTVPLRLKDGTVVIAAPSGRFYYQGDLDTAVLPWSISVSYLLDETPSCAAEIAGSSGKLEIVIDIEDNPDASPVFAENYLVQVALELDREKCHVTRAKGATIAAAGAKQILNLIKFPDEAAHFRIIMQVNDFEMDGIQISAVPFSMEFALPDSSGLVGDLNKLEDGIDELDSGVQELADGAGELTAGAQKMNDGLHEMHEAMEELRSGFGELVDHNPELRDGSRQIRDALNEINDGLKGFDAAAGDLSRLTALVEGSAAIKAGLEGLAGGLGQLGGSFAEDGDASKLLQANANTSSNLKNEAEILEQQIENLPPEIEEVQNIRDQIQLLRSIAELLDYNNALLTGLQTGVCGTVENPGLAAGAIELARQYQDFDSAIQGLPAQLGAMAAGIGGLKEGIDQLAARYHKEFHPGLGDYLWGTAELEDGYRRLVKGFGEIVDGSDELQEGMLAFQEGVEELAEGTGEMKGETAGMDATARKKIDDLLASYTPGSFEPVSFTSPRNTNIEAVQFVMLTETIKPEEEEPVPEPPPAKPSFWQRFLALFSFISPLTNNNYLN